MNYSNLDPHLTMVPRTLNSQHPNGI